MVLRELFLILYSFKTHENIPLCITSYAKKRKKKKRLPSSYTLLNTVDNFKGGILVYLKKGHEKLFPSIDFFSLHSWFPVFTYPSFLLVFHWKGSTAWVHLFHLWPRKKRLELRVLNKKTSPIYAREKQEKMECVLCIGHSKWNFLQFCTILELISDLFMSLLPVYFMTILHLIITSHLW